jgi:predicted TIM-barrel enzyme
VAEVLSVADGAIVGTHFKVEGNTWKAVDASRVRRFMDAVDKLRR